MTLSFCTYAAEGPIAVLTLNRPASLNVLNVGLLSEVLEVLAGVREDETIRALIITGAGRGFCAGADLLDVDTEPTPGKTRGMIVAERMTSHFNRVVQQIDELPKPVVSAVNGVAAGGGVGLALAADIVVAARSARFIQVFTPKLAIVPDMGSTWFLSHYLGRARARGLALTGDPLPAEIAAEWGLIWKCVPDEALMREATRIAHQMAALSSEAARMTMSALDMAAENTLPEQLEVERQIQQRLIDRDDFSEGLAAFIEKRTPNFHRSPGADDQPDEQPTTGSSHRAGAVAGAPNRHSVE